MQKVKVGRKTIFAVAIPLQKKTFILLKGKRGYVMCGYLNVAMANKFGDCAVKIVKVSTIKEALGTKVSALTSAARKAGIYKGQPIREVVKIIA